MAYNVRNYNLVSNTSAKLSLSPEEGSLFHACHKMPLTENAELKIGLSIESECVSRPISSSSKNKQKNDLKNHYKSGFPYNRSKQHGSNCSLEFTDQAMAHQEADNHSNKTFFLKSSDVSSIPWQLPPLEKLYTNPIWKDSDLQIMKSDLNAVKGQLEKYDIENWHQHTHAVNPAVSIPNMFRSKARPELLTQAFLKFYEILHKFPVITENLSDESIFQSLHLCEAPGAFVVALNHYLGVNYPSLRDKWQWLGNTLNPYFEGTPTSECISDDRFILHSLKNWYFGKDQTGNLMSLDYLTELEELYEGSDNKVQLVSADGSIDCQGNPAEQETMTHHLHFCEVYAGVSLLAKGGSLILKKFTFFEAESVNLLYVLCCAFEEVAVYKPITSKLGNSEVYVVALRYSCNESIQEFLKQTQKFYGSRITTTMFSREQIPQSFICHVKKCSSFFKDFQVNAIKRNIELYETSSQMKWDYNNFLKKLIVQKFADSNNCHALCISERLVPNTKIEWDRHVYPHTALKWGEQIMKKSKFERLEFLNKQFETLITEHSDTALKMGTIIDQFIMHEALGNLNFELNILFGKPFDLVFISRFCHASVLQVYIHYFKESTPNVEYTLTNKSLFDVKNLEGFIEDKKQELLQIFKSERFYPDTIILDEGNYVGAHNKCHSMEKLLLLLSQNNIKVGDDIILLNVSLLTRLQYGLFFAICSVFTKVNFYYKLPKDADLSLPPFIILSKLKSQQEGKILFDKLINSGWYEGAASKEIHEVVSIWDLIKSPLYPFVCNYNALFCLWNIYALKYTQTNSIMEKE